MVMPPPVELELPITYVGSPFCGGRIIEAEINQLPVDGTRVQIQIFDNNGNVCEPVNELQPLKITVTETSPNQAYQPVSTMDATRIQFVYLKTGYRPNANVVLS